METSWWHYLAWEGKWQDVFKQWRTPWGPFWGRNWASLKGEEVVFWQKEKFLFICICLLNIMSLGLMSWESCESYWPHSIKSTLKTTGHSYPVCPGCRGCRGKAGFAEGGFSYYRAKQESRSWAIHPTSINKPKILIGKLLNFNNATQCIFKPETLAYCRHCIKWTMFSLVATKLFDHCIKYSISYTALHG